MKPTKEQIEKKYRYDGKDLVFAVDSGRHGHRKAGSKAGSLSNQGAVMVLLNGKYYQAHQLIWCLQYGEWPQRAIRHLNGDLSDNTIGNLAMDDLARGKVEGELTVDRLCQMLEYDKDTGVFTWKVSPRNRTLPGDVAGYVNDNGYMLCVIDQQKVRLHRAAWAMVYGEFPSGHLDHINGNRADNRIANLRKATCSENMQNTSVRTDNKTGVKGVHLRKDTGKYTVSIQTDGKNIGLGCFEKLEDAKRARMNAEEKYHPYRAVGR